MGSPIDPDDLISQGHGCIDDILHLSRFTDVHIIHLHTVLEGFAYPCVRKRICGFRLSMYVCKVIR